MLIKIEFFCISCFKKWCCGKIRGNRGNRLHVWLNRNCLFKQRRRTR